MPFLCLGTLADLTFFGHFVRDGLTCFEGQRKVPQLEREGVTTEDLGLNADASMYRCESWTIKKAEH